MKNLVLIHCGGQDQGVLVIKACKLQYGPIFSLTFINE